MTAVLSQTHAAAKATPLILLLIIFIDGLGTALLLPMLPMLLDPGDPAGVVFASTPTAARTAWLYGVLLAGYAFAMMVGAPLLGALSDRIGRRPTLLLAVAGSVAGYALSTWAVNLGSVGLLIAGRLLGGTFAGSVPVAQAMLVQPPDSAMKRIGWVMFAMTAGFFAGPALTGILLAGHTPGASLLLPLQVALTLSVLCLLMAFLLPSTPAPAATTGPSLIRQVLNGFTSPATRRPLLALLWLQIGWNLFYQYLPWMLARQSQTVGSISLLLTVDRHVHRLHLGSRSLANPVSSATDRTRCHPHAGGKLRTARGHARQLACPGFRCACRDRLWGGLHCLDRACPGMRAGKPAWHGTGHRRFTGCRRRSRHGVAGRGNRRLGQPAAGLAERGCAGPELGHPGFGKRSR